MYCNYLSVYYSMEELFQIMIIVIVSKSNKQNMLITSELWQTVIYFEIF